MDAKKLERLIAEAKAELEKHDNDFNAKEFTAELNGYGLTLDSYGKLKNLTLSSVVIPQEYKPLVEQTLVLLFNIAYQNMEKAYNQSLQQSKQAVMDKVNGLLDQDANAEVVDLKGKLYN